MQFQGKSCTWIDVLQEQSANRPHKGVFTFLRDSGGEDLHITYQQLEQKTRSMGAHLMQLGATGQRILLLLEPSMNYILSFLGCLRANAIAVPAYPPNMKKQFGRLLAVVKDAEAKFAITSRSIYSRLHDWIDDSKLQLNWLLIDEIPQENCPTIDLHISEEDIAFLQYTSGSTGNPKGVIINHKHLIENGYRMIERWNIHEHAKMISWLPPYHDMGLIGTILTPLLAGTTSILMTPYHFVQRPFRWLKAISDYQAEISVSPNFGYDLCADKIKPEQRDQLNLSSWRVAVNGSEPIRPATLRKFMEYFESSGFKQETFYPGYGMAEVTLMAAGGDWRDKPVFQHFDTDLLKQGIARPASMGTSGVRELVGNGQSVYGHDIAIVDPETQVGLMDGEIGEIWIKGPCVASGYWNREEESAKTFQAYIKDTSNGPFLRTGDQGFIWDGQVYITSRIKDLIIINGRNFAPQDIEWEIERSHEAVRKNAIAAFSIDHKDEERLVIVTELEHRMLKKVDVSIEVVANQLRRTVSLMFEIPIYDLVFIKRGTMLKTSSGKIQRQAIKSAYLSNELEVFE